MIVHETIVINGRELVRTKSDSGKYLIQNGTGVKYVEAVDIPNRHTYTEIDENVPKEPANEFFVSENFD